MEAGQSQVMEPDCPDNTSGASTFLRFLHMPGELQWNVWSLFCPEVNAEPFLLSFIFNETTSEVYEGDALARTTAAARALLAVHKDSRQLALKALPDTVTFQGGTGIVRFRRERDLMVIYEVHTDPRGSLGPWPYVPGFSDSVVNLFMPGYPYREISLEYYYSFPNLKVVYNICSPKTYKRRDLAWCFSSSTHSSESLNVPATPIYWPNLVRHREYAEMNISRRKFPVGYNLMKAVTKIDRHMPGELPFPWDEDRERHLKNIEVWPIVAKDPEDVWRPKGYLHRHKYTDEEIAHSSPNRPFPVVAWNHPAWVPRPWKQDSWIPY